MSLLMDALKRAEQEGQEEQAAAPPRLEKKQGRMAASRPETQPEDPESALVKGLNPAAGAALDEGFSLVSFGEDDAGLFPETLLDATYMPDAHAPAAETLSGGAVLQFAEGVAGQGLPTPVAAQTVFAEAGARNKTSAAYTWAAITAVVLAIVAAGMWYYYTVTPTYRALPSPQVAGGIEGAFAMQTRLEGAPGADAVSGGEMNAAAMAEDNAVAAAISLDEEGTAPVADSTNDGEEARAIAEDEGAAALDEEMIGPEAAARAALTGTGTLGPQPAASTEKRREGQGSETAALGPAAPASAETTAAPFTISRSRPSAEQGTAIQAAYAAYREGNFALARERYTHILKNFPDNRDALLGLAAIALNAGEERKAAMFYAELLRLNPQDSLAKTMLMQLRSRPDQPDPLARISQLKTMLQQNPQQPALHFTLGNVYAEQGRWAAAQQAFFAAWRLDAANPDYALNLAISLDQLGQPASALDYYRLALELAAARPLQFDPAVVMDRIRVLEKGD